MRPEDLLKIVFVGDPQVSPDGNRVLFGKKTITDKNKYLSHLFTADLEGKTVQWTQGDKSCGGGRWSPDGQLISFVSGREDGQSQIYVISTTGGEARKLTNFPEGSVGGYLWSPDGKWLAVSFREEIPQNTSAAKKEREAKGGSEPPVEIDSVWYRLDGDGYFANQRYKLYLVEVLTGEHKLLYSEDVLGDYSFSWSPNSKELAVIHNVSKKPMVDPPNKQIWRVDLEGQAWKLEGLPKGEKSEPRFSPCGNWIAYAGDIDEKDPWGVRNTKVYLVDAKGGEAKDLTGHLDYDIAVGTLSDSKEAGFGAVLEWAQDGSGLYVQVGTRGEVQLGFVPTTGGLSLLTNGKQVLGVGNISRDGRRIATTYCHATMLPEVAVIEPELGTGNMVPKVLTAFNAAFHEEIITVEPEELDLPTTDGLTLHGWVLKPVNYLEPKRYPAILSIHGGPHAQYGWAFFHELQVYAAAGYVVVYTNPRGSKGYGEEWAAAISGDWGNKDWEDVQAATRWMQHQPYIHPGQMAVMGGSYGGYMTNWVIGHTKDFRCAITDRCVSNMVSMAGNSDFPFNKDGYFKGVAWGSYEKIKELWKQSPIAFFEDVTTPTLVIHSEGDLRCNIEQGEQVFTALQQQGVESRFVRYPRSTSHGMSRMGPPDLRLHRLAEYLNWLGKFLS